MNTVYKSKSQLRTETEDAVAKFLRTGGVIQIVPAKKTRKRTQQTMSSKSTRSTVVGGGRPMGYTRSTFG